jgi:hypothetical protein
MRSIERCAQPSESELLEYVRAGMPVVATGIVDRWPAFREWRSPSAFVDRAGDVAVPLIHLPSNGTRYYPDVKPVATPLSLCLKHIFGSSPDRYYLSQVELVETAPGLADDFSFPAPDPQAAYEPVFFWIGSGGCVSRLHFDLAHNFAAQIVGSRRFRLYPPSESHRLYASITSKFSPVSTLGDTPRESFPLFDPDGFLEVYLGPGDLLFLPGFWWHQVMTDEPGIMITRFWNTPAMTRDRARLEPWAGLLLSRQFAAALEQAALFETEAYRNVSRAAICREALAAGDARAAQLALGQIGDSSFALPLTELLGGAAGRALEARDA